MGDERCSFDHERECIGLQKANMLEAQMKEWKETARRTHKELYDRTRALELNDTKRDQQYETIIQKLDEFLAWKNESQAEPGKRWKSIVDKAIMLFVGAVAAYVFSKIGL